MVLALYAHPFSSYSRKVLIAFYENETPFEFRMLGSGHERDPRGVDEARSRLSAAYGWLDGRMRDREWAAIDAFSLADCAAAPSLFYADWVHPIEDAYASLGAYRARLLKRASFARAVDEARPYRPDFPPGAPDRD